MEPVNLDRFMMSGNRFGTIRGHNYIGAWPGAAGEIEVSLCYQRTNLVVQFGHSLDNPDLTYWRRERPMDGSLPWSVWKEDLAQGGESNGNNAKVSRCVFEAGSATVFLPGWHKIAIIDCAGEVLMSMENGGCHVMSTGITEYETTGFVQQSYDQWVCYGVSRDGGPVTEVGRQQVKGAEQFVYYRSQFYSTEGTYLEFYISSTFQWAPTVWRDVQMQAVQG